MPPVVAAVVAGISWAVTAVGITGVVAAYTVAVLTAVTFAGAAALIAWGVGSLISAAGSAIGPNGPGVSLTAQVNPLAPWNVCYGRCRVGGSIVFESSFGDNDKYLDLVVVLACHPCESVDWLVLDNKKVQIGSIQTTTNGWKGVSFTPLQQTIAIPSTSDITRVDNVVTISLPADIPLLAIGDLIDVSGVHPVNLLINGIYPVLSVSHSPGSPGSCIVSFLSGGPAIPPGTIVDSGQVSTVWPDYKQKIYMEVMLGTQTLGQTFDGMTIGTPYDGDYGDMQVNPANPWTANCSLLGKTAVFLRLHYDDTVFGNGLPQISFLLHGKKDIQDPRTSPVTVGYTENAALCIADYLSDTTWGYKAVYGTEIPTTDLIATANICDEAVALALPVTSPPTTEPRYTCNGTFPLSMKRVEVLQNLLTSCAGRITYSGGQFRIFAGAWNGVSSTITGTQLYGLLVGNFQWRGSASVTNLFNGVKGTYISQVNNWQPADFPRYAQDTYHGYTWGTAPNHDANLDADGGDRRWLDVQLPFTISAATAQRIAKIELLRRRHQGTGMFPLNMTGYQWVPMDVIEVDLPYLGWSGKTLEILGSRLKLTEGESESDVKPMSLSVELDVQETDSSIYSWTTGEELSPEGYQQVSTPNNQTPAAPTNFTATTKNGNIYLTWTAPADAFVTNGGHLEIQYQLVASPAGLWISIGKIDPGITTAEIDGLVVGDQYYVQIRSVNVAGVPSAWVPVSFGSPAVDYVTVAPPVLWSPNYETPLAGDPLFSAKSFGISQTYQPAANGAPLPSLNLYGDPPTDPELSLVFKLRREFVSGIFEQTAASVTNIDPTHGTIAFGGSGGTTNQFVGRVLSKMANAVGSTALIPIQDFTVTANDTSGNFTVTPDPVAAGCNIGDVFALRTAPTAADATSFTDNLFTNLYNAGLAAHANKGNLVLVIAGHGAGHTPQTVVDNTTTKVTVSPGWAIVPDATSVIVLVEAIPQVVLSPDPTNATGELLGSIPPANYSGQPVRIEGYTSSGIEGPIETVPFREIYIWGAQGTRTILATDPDAMLLTDHVLRFDTSAATQPSPTTLSAAITTTNATSISATSGANVVNGTVIQIDSEQMYVVSGAGTTTLTVQRGWNGTTAATHLNGATVTLPGARTWTIISFAGVPNQDFIFEKISTDINYVKLVPQGSDQLPDGEAFHILPDNSSAYGTYGFKVPGN